MNSFDEELQGLFDEIDRLKKENDDLKNQILTFQTFQNEKIDFDSFLAKKYLSLHDNVVKDRLKQTEEKIKQFEINKRKLIDEKLNVDEVLESSDYKEKNNQILKNDDVIQGKIKDLEKKKQSITDFYQSRLNDLEQPIIFHYNTLIQNLNKEYINEEFDRYIADLNASYPISVEAKKLRKRLDDEIKQLDIEKKHYLDESKQLKKEKDNLIKDVESNFDSYISKMMNHYDNTIELENKLKEEIITEYNIIKDKNLRGIVSQINYYHLLKLDEKEISDKIERLIEKLIENLASEETFENLKMNKEVRLNEVRVEIDKLEPIYNKLMDIKKKENHYYEIYISSSNALDELIDYLDDATLAINECEKYSEVVKKYLSLRKSLTDLKLSYDKLNKDFEQIEKERQEKALCAFPEDEIKELTNELAKINSERFKITGRIEDVKYEKEKIEKNYSNLQLLTVLREKEYIEEKIPKLYSSLRELKVIISDYKYQEQELEKELKDYKKLLIEKERLEDELNNQ